MPIAPGIHILSNPFLEFFLLTPTFSMLDWHFETSSASPWNLRCPGRGDCLASGSHSHDLFLLKAFYAILKWIWTWKTYDLTDHLHTVGSFFLANANASMGRNQQISRWIWFFQLQHSFSFVPILASTSCPNPPPWYFACKSAQASCLGVRTVLYWILTMCSLKPVIPP